MPDATHFEKFFRDVEGLLSVAIIIGCILAGIAVSRAVSTILFKISVREFGDMEPLCGRSKLKEFHINGYL